MDSSRDSSTTTWRERFRALPLVRFIGFVGPHLRYVVGAALMGIGKFALPLTFPFTFKYILDVIVVPEKRLEPTNALIERWVSWLAPHLGLPLSAHGKLAALSLSMFAIFVLQAVATYLRNYWAEIAGNRLIFDLRSELFSHVQRLSHSFFDRNPSGSIVSRLVNDVALAQNFVGSAMTDVWMDGAALGLVIWFLFILDGRLALIAISVIPFYVCMVRYFSPRIRKASRGLQELMEDFSGHLQERVAGAGTVKAFAREELELERFRLQAMGLCERTIDKAVLASRQQMLTELITRVAPMVVVWSAALMILGGSMSIGTVVAFIGLIGYVYQPLQRFAELSIVVSSSLAAIERIFAFLDLRPQISDHVLSRPLRVKRATVEFDRVSFAYSPRNGHRPREVLHDIHLRIQGGMTVALVGRSGAGKTTLASLIPRFYEVTSGRVLIDGKDVRHLTLRSLRDQIGIVTQDTTVFSAAVREILRYGKPNASDAELWHALEQANLRSFVEELPQKLDTVIGERGVKVSGGQRQRLAVARAFLKNPAILILDEATSALDSESENLVHEAMRRLMEGRTTLLIAHRLRSAVDADLIVALDRGRIVETGTHEELLARNGLYTTLLTQQLRGLAADEPDELEPASEDERPAFGARS